MKLPPLPPMKRPSEGKPRVRATGPAVPAPVAPTLTVAKEFTPARRHWGDVGVGRWYEAKDGTACGVCCRCLQAMPARELRWAVGPFMRWEGWACGPCRKEAKGLERTHAASGTRDKKQKIALPVKSNREVEAKIRAYFYEKDELPTERWENEGGATW